MDRLKTQMLSLSRQAKQLGSPKSDIMAGGDAGDINAATSAQSAWQRLVEEQRREATDSPETTVHDTDVVADLAHKQVHRWLAEGGPASGGSAGSSSVEDAAMGADIAEDDGSSEGETGDVAQLLHQIKLTRQDDAADWSNMQRRLRVQTDKDSASRAATQRMAVKLQDELFDLSSAISQQQGAVERKLSVDTDRMDAAISRKFQDQESEMTSAKMRQTFFTRRIRAALSAEAAAIQQLHEKYSTLLAKLTHTMQKDENAKAAIIIKDHARDDEQMKKESLTFEKQVRGQMTALQNQKEELQMQLDRLAALSSSQEHSLGHRLHALQHEAGLLNAKAADTKHAFTADEQHQLAVASAIQKNVSAFRGHEERLLEVFNAKIERMLQERTTQSAVLQGAMETLSSNVTVEEDQVNKLLHRLQHSQAVLERSVKDKIGSKAAQAQSQIAQLSAEAKEMMADTREWAKQTADKQSSMASLVDSNSRDLASLISSEEKHAASTTEKVSEIRAEDNKVLGRIEEAVDVNQERSKTSNAALFKDVQEAKAKIVSRLQREQANVDDRILAAEEVGDTARTDLREQLNSTLRMTDSMLDSYMHLVSSKDDGDHFTSTLASRWHPGRFGQQRQRASGELMQRASQRFVRREDGSQDIAWRSHMERELSAPPSPAVYPQRDGSVYQVPMGSDEWTEKLDGMGPVRRAEYIRHLRHERKRHRMTQKEAAGRQQVQAPVHRHGAGTKSGSGCLSGCEVSSALDWHAKDEEKALQKEKAAALNRVSWGDEARASNEEKGNKPDSMTDDSRTSRKKTPLEDALAAYQTRILLRQTAKRKRQPLAIAASTNDRRIRGATQELSEKRPMMRSKSQGSLHKMLEAYKKQEMAYITGSGDEQMVRH